MRFYVDQLGIEVVRRQDQDLRAEFRFPAGGPSPLVELVDETDVKALALLGQFVGMSVTVGDIRQALEPLIARGVRFEALPSRQVWGGMLAHFSDPDGHTWSLVEGASG